MAVLITLLLAVELGSGFSGATVTGNDIDATRMEIELSVDLARSEGPVIAHFLLPGSATEVVPLLDRGSGRWGAITEVRRAEWHVVFEDVASGALSEEVSLTDLGLDPALLGRLPATVADPGAASGDPLFTWLWLALGLAAASLAVLALRLRRVSLSPRHRRPRSPSR